MNTQDIIKVIQQDFDVKCSKESNIDKVRSWGFNLLSVTMINQLSKMMDQISNDACVRANMLIEVCNYRDSLVSSRIQQLQNLSLTF